MIVYRFEVDFSFLGGVVFIIFEFPNIVSFYFLNFDSLRIECGK